MIIPKYDFILYKYTTENLEFEKGYVIDENGSLKKVEDDKYCVVYFREVTAKNTFVAIPRTLRVSAARLIELKYITTDGLTKIEVLKTTLLVEGFTRLVERVALQSETAVYHIEYFAINDKSSNEVDINEETLFYEGSLVTPHYKTLSKKYSKENSQQFFRQSLEGKVSFFGKDYEKIDNSSINTKFALYIYNNTKLYIATTFSKLDCKIDKSRKSVELKLTAEDEYSLILSKYENEYDLLKLAPAITQARYKKRPALQIYIQGANTVSTYFNGLYEEQEVSEIIEDSSLLQNTYHFGKVQSFSELSVPGLEAFMSTPVFSFNGKDAWVAPSGAKFILRLIYSAGQLISNVSDFDDVYHLSSDSKHSEAIRAEDMGENVNQYYAVVDIYQIQWVGLEEQGSNFEWRSARLYTITNGTTLKAADSGYTMVDAAGHRYDLAKDVVSYNVWARIIGDSEALPYDINSDDFALPRTNYKKCVGVVGESIKALIFQSTQTSETPTKYGLTDYGTYFTNTFFEAPFEKPYTTVLPIGRSAWVNSSLWIISENLENFIDESGSYYEAKYTTEVILKDGFQIADVIKAFLRQLDPSLKHENTKEYSVFLYSTGKNIINGYSNYNYIITPKSNILKGNYDQAAQKAELSFKSLMEMLRDCFRCYWFIDEQKRFRIEHISYFTQGGNYVNKNEAVQIDLTASRDKFNGKKYSFFQNELTFDKTELVSRYEFSWMDEVSDAMGNIAIDIKDPYIQKDKSENINVSKFSTDIDLMLLLPNNFSSDGFALIAVDNSTGIIPTISTYLWDETRKAAYSIKAQNYPLAWSRLINNYLYDMPGKNISYNTVPPANYFIPNKPIGEVKQIKKCMAQSIQFPTNRDLDTTQLIQTEIGKGTISEMLINIDTLIANITLQYYPE